MQYPWTSRLAQCVAFSSLFMVVVSTFTFVLSTVEELQVKSSGQLDYPIVVTIIEVVDHVVVIFFTLEYLIRLTVCPRKITFIKNAMNMVDLLAILPFYVSLVIEGLEDYEIIGKAGKIIRLIRIMRILRIFKLVRHFAGLQSLIHTLQQAYQELGLLLVLVAVAILTYSSLVYFAEKDPDRSGLNCTSEERPVLPKERDPCYSWTFVESFWWVSRTRLTSRPPSDGRNNMQGLMTLTTVGYDLNPKTLLGED